MLCFYGHYQSPQNRVGRNSCVPQMVGSGLKVVRGDARLLSSGIMESYVRPTCAHQRVIVHVDFDCYYAQVEIIKNPALKNKPVGVRQKNIIVTCDYLAREKGVKKLMLLKVAKDICPDLVIVPGEDLTEYRDVSYKVSRFLQEKFQLVEKLGMDENFIDVSSEVDKRLEESKNCVFEAVGHVFQGIDTRHTDELDECCSCNSHQRLNLGSIIAEEIRDSITEKFQLTCCAGIAHNKLLAKLACAVHKPSQQTLIYPEHIPSFLNGLSLISRIPGIGPSTCKKLSSHSIETLSQLQECSMAQLESFLGKELSFSILNLSRGVDDSAVVPFGKPLSIGLEDSFQKGLSYEGCKTKINKMVEKLLERMKEDGRTPSTIRLVLRKGSSSRESRQCPLPVEVFKSACSQTEKGLDKILSLIWMLFAKLSDTSDASQLTLIGVTFTKLVEPEKSSIDKYLKRPSPSGLPEEPDAKRICEVRIPSNVDSGVFNQLPDELKLELLQEWKKDSPDSKPRVEQAEGVPHNVDSEVFMELPDFIKKELQQKWQNTSSLKSEKKNTITNYFAKKL